MGDVKNGVSETTATSGGAGVGQIITLTGAENSWNATFQDGYGGAVTDIPVAVRVGDDWQTCRCDFNGTNQLTVQSIQSQFKAGVYDDTAPIGITLAGTPVAQLTFNAADFNSFLKDFVDAEFPTYALFEDESENPGVNPVVIFSTNNNHLLSNVSVGTVNLVPVAGKCMHGTVRVPNSTTISAINSSGTIYWAGGVVPAWAGETIISMYTPDGTDIYLAATIDFGTPP